MTDETKVITKSLYFKKTNEGYVSEPLSSRDCTSWSEAVLFLAGSGRYTVLGIERACNGDYHDADGCVEFTEIGSRHTEWGGFNVKYIDCPGWGAKEDRIIVDCFAKIDLDEWEKGYDEWGNGECEARHVLAKDNETGETVLFRITWEWEYFSRSAYYADEPRRRYEKTEEPVGRYIPVMEIKKISQKGIPCAPGQVF